MALKPENPVVGGTVLRRAAIQSPNFVTGVSGWTINQDGSAEFNNVTIRGGQVIGGTALYYNGTPAAGNLVFSIAVTANTDRFGNHYLGGGAAWYSATSAVAIQSGSTITYYIGSLAAGWTPTAAEIDFASSTQIDITAAIIATSGTQANPTLITTDTWNTASLVNSWAGSGSATNGLFYRLTIDNEVRLIGDLSSPGTASVITTLPAGYRPGQGVNVEFNRYDDSGTAHALIAANGTVTMQTVVGSGKGLFCNASFPLDNL